MCDGTQVGHYITAPSRIRISNVILVLSARGRSYLMERENEWCYSENRVGTANKKSPISMPALNSAFLCCFSWEATVQVFYCTDNNFLMRMTTSNFMFSLRKQHCKCPLIDGIWQGVVFVHLSVHFDKLNTHKLNLSRNPDRRAIFTVFREMALVVHHIYPIVACQGSGVSIKAAAQHTDKRHPCPLVVCSLDFTNKL